MRRIKVIEVLVIIVAIMLVVPLSMPRIVSAQDGFCTQTSNLLFSACKADTQDNFLVARAICLNEPEQADRAQCNADATASRDESLQLCQDQLDWRLEGCQLTGEDRYHPEFEPALFDNPKNPTKPNPYFPLKVGNRWQYVSGSEFNTVEITSATKLIDEVRCIVAHDQVFDDGDLIEDTDDWYAPAKVGDTWYCGEETKSFESFKGDKPMIPELVSIDGTFKAGRDGDEPGIIFPASPKVGQVYREEFSLGNAEDIAEVVSTTYKFGSDPELDHLVPKKLADRFCSASDCVVTFNRSLLEPGVIERKYYGRGIGNWLEVVPDTGEVIQLVNCNFDSRCNNLPQP
jgi:hypothetical protein